MAVVEEEQEGTSSSGAYNNDKVSEIVEEENCNDLFEISNISEEEEDDQNGMSSRLFSFDVDGNDNKDCVYVCVGKSQSSMDALSWALKNCVTNQESTIIYLIHVFPRLVHIPSPLGKLPKSQVNPEQVESHMAQESGKRGELLQKFIYMCSDSKVKVDTILIESDEISKAILDLIPILNMRKLVVGTSKSSLRKSKSTRGIGIADAIVENAPEYCDVKMISDGKEAIWIVSSPPVLPLSLGDDNSNNTPLPSQQQQSNNTVLCMHVLQTSQGHVTFQTVPYCTRRIPLLCWLYPSFCFSRLYPSFCFSLF